MRYTTSEVAILVFNELYRLSTSVVQDPYSGLMTAGTKLRVDRDPNIKVISVYCDRQLGYSDRGRRHYDGLRLLAFLTTLEAASLDPTSELNIWGLIAEFEV